MKKVKHGVLCGSLTFEDGEILTLPIINVRKKEYVSSLSDAFDLAWEGNMSLSVRFQPGITCLGKAKKKGKKK